MTVDDTHVKHIAEALLAGVEMPNVIAQAETFRIVDGIHRERATRRAFGDDAKIRVELYTYESEAELLLDAVRLNACHGRNMTTSDRAHAILLAGRLKAPVEDLARALNITVERMEEIKTTLTIKVEDTRQRIPLKMPIRFMTGRELTKKQAAVVPRLGGNSALFWVHQLCMLIESDMIDTSNEKLMDELERLSGLIRGLKVHA